MRSFGRYSVWLAITLCLFHFGAPMDAEAGGELCDKYRSMVPRPDGFEKTCNELGISRAGGAAFSSFSGPINLNPSMIPTLSLPLGVEYVTSFSNGRANQNDFSILNGHNGFGFALWNNTDNTIYGNSSNFVSNSSLSSPLAQGLPTNDQAPSTLSLGTAISFASLLPKDLSLLPSIGGSIRQSSGGGEFGYGIGGSFTLSGVTLSLSKVNDPASATTPKKQTTTATAGFTLSALHFEFAYIKSKSDPRNYTFVSSGGQVTTVALQTTDPDPTYLGTLSAQILGFKVTGAARRYQDATLAHYVQYHLAIHRQLTSSIGIAYYNNYIPGYQSLGLQYLL